MRHQGLSRAQREAIDANRDPLTSAFAAHASQQADLFNEMVAALGYETFHEAASFQLYRRCLRLGMLDRYSSDTEEQKAERLKTTPEVLAEVRADPFFAVMLTRIDETMKRLSSPRTAEEIVNGAGHVALRKLAVAMSGPNVREANKAAAAFADRIAPKVRKEEIAHKVSLDEKSIKALEAGFASMQRAGILPGEGMKALPAVAADIIEGEVLDGDPAPL